MQTNDLLGMCIDELRPFSGDQNIAGQGDLQTGCDREPINGSDDGLGAELHLGDGVGLGVLNVALEDVLRGGEIDSGAEGSAGPGQDYGPDRVIPAQGLDSASKIHHHGPR